MIKYCKPDLFRKVFFYTSLVVDGQAKQSRMVGLECLDFLEFSFLRNLVYVTRLPTPLPLILNNNSLLCTTQHSWFSRERKGLQSICFESYK